MMRTPADRPKGLVRRVARTMLLTGGVAALICGAVNPTAHADPMPALKYPEPSPFALSWQLRFIHGTPKRIVVHLANQQFATAYWYMTYTAINRPPLVNPEAPPSTQPAAAAAPAPILDPGRELPFELTFDLLAANGKVYAGNVAIPDEVFDAIKKQEANALLTAPRKVVGTINPGEDQAKDSVAIWQEPMRKMGTFSIFVGGLSGEALTLRKIGDQWIPVTLKVGKDKDGKDAWVPAEPTEVPELLKGIKEEDRQLLRKQFQMTYQVVGDERNTGKDPVVLLRETWVMR